MEITLDQLLAVPTDILQQAITKKLEVRIEQVKVEIVSTEATLRKLKDELAELQGTRTVVKGKKRKERSKVSLKSSVSEYLEKQKKATKDELVKTYPGINELSLFPLLAKLKKDGVVKKTKGDSYYYLVEKLEAQSSAEFSPVIEPAPVSQQESPAKGKMKKGQSQQVFPQLLLKWSQIWSNLTKKRDSPENIPLIMSTLHRRSEGRARSIDIIDNQWFTYEHSS
jgi:hypothetical protein